MEKMFKDIGLEWGLDKCSTVNMQRGKLVPSEDLPLNEKDSISILDENDQYKFLGKFENVLHLDEMVFEYASKEHLRRLSVIWSSNISIPRKIKATNTFAMPTLLYHMWTADWLVNDLKQLDRETRKIIQENRALHTQESAKLMYLPTSMGGKGLKQVEMTYKTTKIKVAN